MGVPVRRPGAEFFCLARAQSFLLEASRTLHDAVAAVERLVWFVV